MEISIIIPTYNRQDLLKSALASIAAQTFNDYEVVLVNDGGVPLDDVIEKSGIEDRIKYIVNPENLGQTKSLNIGLEKSSGRFISYLDDDDIYFSNHLEILYNFLTSNKHEFAFTNCIRTVINPDNGIIVKADILPSEEYAREKLFTRNVIHIISTMHRKECLEKSGLFDVNLKFLKDCDLFVRLSEHYKFHHIDEITCEAFFRTDKSNMTFQFWDERVKLGEKLREKYTKKYGKVSQDYSEDPDITYSKKLEQSVILYPQFKELDKFLSSHFMSLKNKGIRKVAIFGASTTGDIYIDYLRKNGLKVVAVFDNDPLKKGKSFKDLLVQSPKEISEVDADSMIITSRGYKEEIFQQIKSLENKGLKIFKE